MRKLAPYWKAVAGFVGPAIVVLGYALLATSPGGSSITGEEWVLAAVACFGTAGTVYAAPKNAPAPPKPEGGQANVDLVLLCGIFVGVVLLLFGVSFR